MGSRHQLRRGTISSSAAAIAFLSIVLAVGAALLVYRLSATEDGSRRSEAPVLPSDEPFPNAEEVSLAEAIQKAGFPVYRPSDFLASDESLTAVWLQSQAGEDALGSQVALYYASGVKAYLSISPESDVRAYLDALRAQLSLPSEDLVSINGHLALLIPQVSPGATAEPRGTSFPPNAEYPGSVTIIFDGIQVALIGQFDSATLIRIAETVTDK